MKLVAVVVHILRCVVAPRRSIFNVRLSHLVPIGSCIQTNLYGVGVNAEYRFAAVYSLGCGLMNNLTKSHICTTLLELTTCNKVGDGSWTLGVQSVE